MSPKGENGQRPPVQGAAAGPDAGRAQDQGRGYLRLVTRDDGQAPQRPRPQLAVMPDGAPDLFGACPSAPPNTSTEWLVSWCWPRTPDKVRRRVFHARGKAEAWRTRLERGFDCEDQTPVTVRGETLIVRIDARHCSPWVEVA